MAQLSTKLRSVGVTGGDGIAFWCPGCDVAHVVAITGARAWSYNGNPNKPTFTPSILVRGSDVNPQCHSFVRDGQIQFLGDSTHPLKGQIVPVPDWPSGIDGLRRDS